ncbi:MAG: hypothetical protein A2445_05570 [Candidatus Jacksonbacteria bacterium RIFOXYC2_FULL_44_29]|nr:MAG: hypothetical protein A2240_01505 [Candidatus Jacksonbacteria bacterium RIFOXYA2_FULL_43_12]OGY79477.1 MAG: hypothetical protein A2550_04190 [Candidatus Jacksonbacteria bacterium RIFOXYD2_FULL_43_21]OGY81000.1 MAG: hypothetical protein A2445_05570 [Candidatus Jacksonbacteria bacterium RIFOXYC2_FULL_44_29]HBH46919.1 hypothetical protein [Candidatus Jacksonbacteria bacterium]HCC49431.1 hypothetical protein [Candidatus Jacksonbacteria bacterium]
MFIINQIVGAAWFVTLLGIANIAPVIVVKLPWLATPVDFGGTLNGIRIFGDNKTWRGILAAIILGFLGFLLIRYLNSRVGYLQEISLINYQSIPWFFGFVIPVGVMAGDLVKSFFKRRRGVAPGQSWLPFDQIDFLLGGILVSVFFINFSIMQIVLILVIGFLIHLAVKYLGYKLKIGPPV